MMNIAETWRDIPDLEYSVSDHGRVASRRLGGWRVLKPTRSTEGYMIVNLTHKRPRKQSRVHALVAAAFLGPKPTPTHEVNHKDGDKANNSVDNLEWVTHSENVKHSIRVLGHPSNHRGARNSNAKLDDHKVRTIRAWRERGQTVAFIAREFSVSEANISSILKRQSWAHVT